MTEASEQETSTPSKYRFADAPLTASIFSELAIELFAGRVANLTEIRNDVESHHLQNGGLPPNAQKPEKRAMARLLEEGKAERISKARYRFASFGSSNEGRIASEVPPPKPPVATPSKDAAASEKWLGTGEEIVYVYTYSVYRELAELKGEKDWPVKVGMSRTGLSRVYEQAGTAYPEDPTVLLAIRTDNAQKLERAIHENLKYAGRRRPEARGSEWFNASSSIIEEIYTHIPQVAR